MAKLIACTRCQSQIDVTNAPPGSTVRCGECNSLVRISTGAAEPIPSLPPATAARSSRRGGGRRDPLFNKFASARPPGIGPARGPRAGGGTRMRRGAAPAKKNNTPVIIGVIAGAVILVVLVVVLASRGNTAPGTDPMKGTTEELTDTSEPKPASSKTPEKSSGSTTSASKKEEKSGIASTQSASGIPDNFEGGVRNYLTNNRSGIVDLGLDKDLKSEYESLAKSGNVSSIVASDHKWMPYIIDGLLSDDETLARTTYQALHNICDKHKIWAEGKDHLERNPIKMKNFNSLIARAGEYEFWSEWYGNNKKAVETWGTGGDLVIKAYADKENWDDLMSRLRAGGGFDDMTQPSGVAFAKIKSMGKTAYPHLVRYIGNEDLMLARAAVTVLNELTGRDEPLPRPDTREALKGRWESWLADQ